MNDIREKLKKLLLEVDQMRIIRTSLSDCVDYLIANGVTVQQWIPVTERLPEKDEDVLMLFKSGNMAVGFWHDGDEHITFWRAYTDDGYYSDCDTEPTHWMPLPEPPKEVE